MLIKALAPACNGADASAAAKQPGTLLRPQRAYPPRRRPYLRLRLRANTYESILGAQFFPEKYRRLLTLVRYCQYQSWTFGHEGGLFLGCIVNMCPTLSCKPAAMGHCPFLILRVRACIRHMQHHRSLIFGYLVYGTSTTSRVFCTGWRGLWSRDGWPTISELWQNARWIFWCALTICRQ